MTETSTGTGKLATNILYFARILRMAGLPVGPGSVIDAVDAVEAAGIGNRTDFRATLHAVFVKKHEHDVIFDQAFELYWRHRGYVDQLLAMMGPQAERVPQESAKPPAGATRLSQALFNKEREQKQKPQVELDYRLTMSDEEILQRKDFAQMSVEEIERAKASIARLRLSRDEIATRRFVPAISGTRMDPRRSFRRSLRAGGASIELAFRAPAIRRPPIVAICDISGSMSDYTRVFLHFLHALGEARSSRVHTFLFGTRLTNVTRALRHKDVDEALASCSAHVDDWSGGTRIATSLHDFNRLWSRRVLGQGASVLLFTDGLERDGAADLAREMERLNKSCRRLIWLNPLLRYDRFEPRAQGIRAMLPHVDEFRPIHNLASIQDLVQALGASASAKATDPRDWMKRGL
jgi:hypothetical protein